MATRTREQIKAAAARAGHAPILEMSPEELAEWLDHDYVFGFLKALLITILVLGPLYAWVWWR